MNVQGSLQVLDCTITNQFNESVNLVLVSEMIEIYESIHEKFLSGQVSVRDGLELLKKYKLTGQESLTLRFRQGENGKIITKIFKVYSITDISPENDNFKTYSLQFVDPYFFIFERTVVDRVFRGSMASMLEKVLIEDSKVNKNLLYVEETVPPNKQLICPKWRVSSVIDYITKNSSPKGKTENTTYDDSMFFYQSLSLSTITGESEPYGKFYFKSFDTMLSDITEHKFNYYPMVTDRTFLEEDNEEEQNKPGGKNSQILDYAVIEKNNSVRAQKLGFFSSKLFNFDLLRGVFETYDYSLNDLFKKNGHLSKFAPYYVEHDKTFEAETSDRVGGEIKSKELEELTMESPDKYSESNLYYSCNSTNMFSNQNEILDYTQTTTKDAPVGPESRSSGMLERNAILTLIKNNSMNIKVPFRDDLKVGEVVNVNIPSTEFSEDMSNKIDTGFYLIISMK